MESGTYYESELDITKPLTLMGAGQNQTIVNFYAQYLYPGNYPPAISIEASKVAISGFTLAGGEAGIELVGGNQIRITQNNIISNVGNGIASDHATNNLVISENSIMNDYGAIGVEGNNLLISQNKISNNTFAISVKGENEVISDNILFNNSFGITVVSGTSNLDIQGNCISGCKGNNQVAKEIGSNYEFGFGIQFREGNSSSIVRDNSISANTVGIDVIEPIADNVSIVQGSGNEVYQNNIVNNTQNAKVEINGLNASGSANGVTIVSWDNGKVGNYWSDYNSKYPNAVEIDASGIGNTPYVIDQNNIDRYPLMQQVNITTEEKPTAVISLLTAAIITLVAVLIVVTLLLIFARYKTKKK